MQTHRNVLVQRAIVLHMLTDDTQHWWSRDELKGALAPSLVDDALTALIAEGVVRVEDDGIGEEEVCLSRCAEHLSDLCLIAV
jgi:hypothetical protein